MHQASPIGVWRYLRVSQRYIESSALELRAQEALRIVLTYFLTRHGEQQQQQQQAELNPITS